MSFMPSRREFENPRIPYCRPRDIQLYPSDFGWTVLEMTESSGCYVIQHPDYQVALATFREELATHYVAGVRVRATIGDVRLEVRRLGAADRYLFTRHVGDRLDLLVDFWDGYTAAWGLLYALERAYRTEGPEASVYLHLGADDGTE